MAKIKQGATFLAAVAATCIACSSAGDGDDLFPGKSGDNITNTDSFTGGTPDGGSGGGAASAKACTADAECGSGGTCNAATKMCACGGVSVPAEIVPANLLVVLDRSCSMQSVVSGTKTKWTIAVGALQNLLAKQAGKIRFGLELFPDKVGAECTQGAVAVPVAAGAEAKISGLLGGSLTSAGSFFPNGPCVTNIDTAVIAAESEPSFKDATRESFVLLVTDGKQSGSCSAGGGDTGTTKAIGALRAKGVDTFVVGFGTGVDATQMNVFATAGGQARAGANKFYDAADEASLEAALTAIAKRTLGCTLELASPPPDGDPSQLFVFLGSSPDPLARDATHADGWDYDAAAQNVTIYGSKCEALKDGAVERASVVVGCPGGAPPENPVK